MTRVRTRALEPDDWPRVRALFGDNGACGGCWCMHWRTGAGEDWDALKGDRNRDALRRLVRAGRVHAVLALEGDDAVGWCCLGPRASFPRLGRSRVMRSTVGDDAWAVVCFFLPAAYRGRGVATSLLRGAVDLARAHGARALEGFPVRPRSGEGRYPSTFAYVGVPRLFEKAGFRDVTPAGSSRPVYLRRLRPRS